MSFIFEVLDLGLIDYRDWLDIQNDLFNDISLKKRQSVLALCEHPAVITLGRNARPGNILRPMKVKALGIEEVRVNRGGDVTIHLPGQLVIYPVFDLSLLGRDIGLFLRAIEKVLISVLGAYSIKARRNKSRAGVWAGEKKIASIGISVSRWISTHGAALNVDCDMDLFSLIRPCGEDIMMTSMRNARGDVCFELPEIKKDVVKEFHSLFNPSAEIPGFCFDFTHHLGREPGYL